MKYTLITNIDFVLFGETRLEAHALLIVEDPGASFTAQGYRIRGFLACDASQVFDMRLSQSPKEFTLRSADSSQRLLILSDGAEDTQPLFAGAILQAAEAQLFLQKSHVGKQFKIERFDDISQCWNVLAARIAEFWTCPHMPQVDFESADVVRRSFGVRA